MPGPLTSEVRQTLSLFALTALTMVVYVGLWLIAVRVLG